MKVLAVMRDVVFSPNSVDKDRAILLAAANCLGSDVVVVDENNIPDDVADFDICLSMARQTVNLDKLALLATQGLKVINNPLSIKACTRSIIETVMHGINTPLAPAVGDDGYWIKRGDMAAQTKGEVRYCKNDEELQQAKADFKAMGIDDYVVSAHVVGDLVKWYAVDGGFFRYYYPSDDGNTNHYAFDADALRQKVEKVAQTIGITAYGGDAIVRADGTFCIIDFNDWPSFSRCREDAAKAIAEAAKRII